MLDYSSLAMRIKNPEYKQVNDKNAQNLTLRILHLK